MLSAAVPECTVEVRDGKVGSLTRLSSRIALPTSVPMSRRAHRQSELDWDGTTVLIEY